MKGERLAWNYAQCIDMIMPRAGDAAFGAAFDSAAFPAR